MSAGFFWFLAVLVLDIVGLVSFNDASFSVFFLDPRNFVKYPVVILTPLIYGLIRESKNSEERGNYFVKFFKLDFLKIFK